MNKNYQTLVLAIEEFGEDLVSVLGQTIATLTKAGYMCEVFEEEVGIYIIRYNYSTEEYGDETIQWLTPNEIDFLKDNYKEGNEG